MAMKPAELVSGQVRTAVREAMVGTSLRQISNLFDAASVSVGKRSGPSSISGERRNLVEDYYASVDWADRESVSRVLEVYEAFLVELTGLAEGPSTQRDWAATNVKNLLRLLKKDGYVWEDDRLRHETDRRLGPRLLPASDHFDGRVLAEHIHRIDLSVDDDPALAIGAAKELLEAVAKMVLEHYHQPNDKKQEQLPQLVGRALECLDLKADKVPEASKAAESSRKVLGSLAGITQGLAELRNLYGTGHGRPRASGILPRHAMLMVGAAATIARFMMATYEDRKKAEAATT